MGISVNEVIAEASTFGRGALSIYLVCLANL